LCGETQRQAGYDNDNLVPVLPDATAMIQTAATLKPNAKNACMASANYLVGKFPTTFERRSSYLNGAAGFHASGRHEKPVH
jgi:hypothetical protein